MERSPPIEQVLLVPGFFSPRWMMWPLQHSLRRAGFAVETWDDASVFDSVEKSVRRLARRLHTMATTPTGVVSHSFGDWLCRQALATTDPPAVKTLVSLVPVMTASRAARAASFLTAGFVPEIRVMADTDKASQSLQLPTLERLVIWARLDPWVRRIDASRLTNTEEVIVAGSHNTVVFQPAVHKLIVNRIRNVGEPA